MAAPVITNPTALAFATQCAKVPSHKSARCVRLAIATLIAIWPSVKSEVVSDEGSREVCYWQMRGASIWLALTLLHCRIKKQAADAASLSELTAELEPILYALRSD